MQILQNFKHNPKINTIFISKVSVACSSPGPGGSWMISGQCTGVC